MVTTEPLAYLVVSPAGAVVATHASMLHAWAAIVGETGTIADALAMRARGWNVLPGQMASPAHPSGA